MVKKEMRLGTPPQPPQLKKLGMQGVRSNLKTLTEPVRLLRPDDCHP